MKKKTFVICEVVKDDEGRPVLKAAHVEDSVMKMRIKWNALVAKHCAKPIPRVGLNDEPPIGLACNDGTFIVITDKVKITA